MSILHFQDCGCDDNKAKRHKNIYLIDDIAASLTEKKNLSEINRMKEKKTYKHYIFTLTSASTVRKQAYKTSSVMYDNIHYVST